MERERFPYYLKRFIKLFLSFLLGGLLAFSVLVITFYALFEVNFGNQVYPGVYVGLTNFGGETQEQVFSYFSDLSLDLGKTRVVFEFTEATSGAVLRHETTGDILGISFDAKTIAETTYKIGRSGDILNDFGRKWEAVTIGVRLEPFVVLDDRAFAGFLDEVGRGVEVEPQDALFSFSGGRVSAFKLSSEGKKIDKEKTRRLLMRELTAVVKAAAFSGFPEEVTVDLPIRIVKARVATNQANDLGVKELLGRGVSYFYDSIKERVFNISLATSRVNGLLVAPGDVFSFNDEIGTISAETGYKKAYSIVRGKTVLDDGGGVCQVSTTLYRAVLNSGLPVVERVAHAYRVGFYEQGGFLPGMDATVYPPSPDFKFRNDTGNWILIQASFDETAKSLTFDLYGSSDGRLTTLSKPVILSTSPPPEPIYNDDPNLPKGTVRELDKAHFGAKVYFTRKVVRGEETLIDERVESNYRPWAAVYVRGTRE